MAQLRFYAREDLLAYAPGSPKNYGQAPPYVGRTLVRGTSTAPSSYPATREPHFAPAESEHTERWAKLCRDGAIWPADPETAAALGVAFVPVVYTDGAWIADSKPAAKEPSKK
jgi:hypothetical protein